MIIEIENLSKTYTRGGFHLPILNNLFLKMDKGETLAILGHSGSGKTTLLSLMAGLERPTSGTINLFGTHLTLLSEKELTRFRSQHIGIVFQQYHLMEHLTTYENVLLPLEIIGENHDQNKKERATFLLQEVGLFSPSSRLHHFPAQLSGGECQRVALARALVTHPPLLLADEPSGNLDQETGKKVMDLMFSLVKKYQTTLVLVTHNQELAHRCDRILQMQAGHL